ncbi:MAG: hypothetical protein K2Q18_07950, partial [Bdellovibrionales bacterium]|nr:hypothetical protein [Bdellovibrionales bacterium]
NSVQGTIDFKALDVEGFLKDQKNNYDAILVNPPRRGLNSSIIENILKQRPRLVIYSSCNAETLARDYLEFKKDYEIQSTQIFDMFPFTAHFETLIVLKRLSA